MLSTAVFMIELLLSLQVSNGVWFCHLQLSYFDHLMQENVTAVAICQNPATSQPVVPLMACNKTEVTVKLPVGTKLKRFTTLGEKIVGKLTTIAEAEYVRISTDGEMVWKIITDYVI